MTDDPRRDLRARFARARLARHADAIAALARPTIFLHLADGASAEPPPGTSRAFGDPDLPAGQPWPAFERPARELAAEIAPGELSLREASGELVRAGEVLRCRLDFIAQVRLDDLAAHDVDGLLPSQGLLSFFLAPEVLLQRRKHPGQGRHLVPSCVLYTADTSSLRPVSPPAGAPPHARRAARPLSFSHALTLPSPDHAAITALGVDRARYGRVAWSHDQDRPWERMLGYAIGAYEFGLPPDGEALLLEMIHADWAHAHAMFVCIHEAALRAHDFSAAYCVPSLE